MEPSPPPVWEPSQKAVEAAAAAMYNLAVSRVKTEVASTIINYNKFDAVLGEIQSTDDRSTVILIFAFIDEMLAIYLREHLNNNINGGVDKLFETWGMLATANARITFAYSLFWINDNTYRDANLIRKIRNMFAHNPEISSFSDGRVSSIVHSMSQYEKPMRDDPIIKLNDRKLTVRQCFLFRSTAVLLNMVVELIVMHRAKLEKVHMKAVVNFDNMPDNLASLQRQLIRYMLIFISEES